ncbi:hypothetical protein AC1031_022027 [Aphanomyces cochlioides]|nr:hypothetical protein AC1031_022027 [Aphanomyces cochlioides]
MRSNRPGVIECRVNPSSQPDAHVLRSKVRSVDRNLTSKLEQVPMPPVNDEKLCEMFKKIRPHVPPEYNNNELYQAPTDDNMKNAVLRKASHRKRAHTQVENEDAVIVDEEVEVYEL